MNEAIEEFRRNMDRKAEQYAVGLVISGANNAASDDMYEAGDMSNCQHAEACNLASIMAITIDTNVAAFLDWFYANVDHEHID
jgi:hypothetical protein